MSDEERAKNTPIMDDGSVWPDDEPFGAWTMKKYVVLGSIHLSNIIFLSVMLGIYTTGSVGKSVAPVLLASYTAVLIGMARRERRPKTF
jgi:hypothetical protein